MNLIFHQQMADIQDPNTGLDQPSPGDDLQGNGVDQRGTKRQRTSMAGDDDDDDDEKGGRERRKIEIKFIQDKSRRHITFSKRKAGIMKKVLSPPSPLPVAIAIHVHSVVVARIATQSIPRPSRCCSPVSHGKHWEALGNALSLLCAPLVPR